MEILNREMAELRLEHWDPTEMTGPVPERFVERCARVAYRSEEKMTGESYDDFIRRIVVRHKDFSVMEHVAFAILVPYGWGLVKDNELLDLLRVNPLIPWEKCDDGLRLLINGRQAMELHKSMIWHQEEEQVRYNGLARTILNALSADQFLGKVVLSDYAGERGVLEKDMEVYEAHKWCRGPGDDFWGTDFSYHTFFVKGVSRVTEVQWVRHRRMSYTVMSGRGVDVRSQPFCFPASVLSAVEKDRQNVLPLDPEDGMPTRMDYGQYVKDALDMSYGAYEALRDCDHNVPRQDARYLLPQGVATEMVVSASLTWWNYFFSLRAHKPAQWEIRSIANPLQAFLHDHFPGYVMTPSEPPQTLVWRGVSMDSTI